MEDKFILGGVELKSRLFIGTGKYSADNLIPAVCEASGAEVITVAMRRVEKGQQGIVAHIPKTMRLLPNTSGARTAENGTVDLDAIVSQLLETNPISNQFEIAAMNIEYDFGLAAEDVTAYKGVRSNDNGDAGLVLVIQPAAGKSEAICEQLQTYKQDQVAFYGNYPEFGQAQANVQNAVIKGSDSLVVMVIASNECDADLGPAVDAVFAQ